MIFLSNHAIHDLREKIQQIDEACKNLAAQLWRQNCFSDHVNRLHCAGYKLSRRSAATRVKADVFFSIFATVPMGGSCDKHQVVVYLKTGTAVNLTLLRYRGDQ